MEDDADDVDGKVPTATSSEIVVVVFSTIMYLTRDELQNKIRPLNWTVKRISDIHWYWTPIDSTSNHLFWIDFFRNIFAERFGRQMTVTNIYNFDTSLTVMITQDLNLIVPSVLEVINHSSEYGDLDESSNPKLFQTPFSGGVALIIGIFILCILYLLSWWRERRGRNGRDDDDLGTGNMFRLSSLLL